jgi:hypothetical protein
MDELSVYRRSDLDLAHQDTSFKVAMVPRGRLTDISDKWILLYRYLVMYGYPTTRPERSILHDLL